MHQGRQYLLFKHRKYVWFAEEVRFPDRQMTGQNGDLMPR
jgi:hypothetical protein